MYIWVAWSIIENILGLQVFSCMYPCFLCFCKDFSDTMPLPIKIKRFPSKDYGSDSENSECLVNGGSTLDRRHAHVRTLSTRRVCWHRNTSISMNEYRISAQVVSFEISRLNCNIHKN